MDNNLTHHGIKGMKWGVRRFQSADGSLTEAGKKRYGEGPGDKRFGKKIGKKHQQGESGKKTNKKAKGEEDNKMSYDEQKQKAIKSGSAKEVLKFKGDLTQQEMTTALNRIKWEKEMQSISDKEISEGRAKTEKFFKNVETATDYTIKAAKAYNAVAVVANAFMGTKHKSLPTIELDNRNKSNKEQRKQEEKQQKKAKEEADKKAAEQKAEKDIEDRIKKAEKKANKKDKGESKNGTYTGKVLGEGKSSRKKADDIIYDAEWRDVSVSNIPKQYTQLGERVVAGLLEDK